MALVPPLLIAILLGILASDVPYWDEWELGSLLVKAKEGTVHSSDFFALHNGHQLAIPKILLILVALATDWNVRAQLLINLGVVCWTLAILVLLARQDRPGPSRALAIVGTSFALFSLAQYDNWLWGWQVAFFATIAFIVTAIAVLVLDRWRLVTRMTAAALLCALATFSSGFGAISWIALAPLVVMARRPGELRSGQRAWRTRAGLWLAVWLAAGTVSTVFSIAAGASSAPVAPSAPPAADLLLFVLAVAGTPWASIAVPAAALGALSLALFSWLTLRSIRSDREGSMPWIALGLVALGFGALAAMARAAGGWEGGASPRYATPAVLLTIAILHLAGRGAPDRRRSIIRLVLVTLLAGASLSFVPLFWSVAESRHVSRVCTDLAFLLDDSEACLPSHDLRSRRWLETARRGRLRPFADSSWFTESDVREADIIVSRDSEGLRIAGAHASRLFAAPILVTEEPDRRPVAFSWTGDEGEFSVRVVPDRLPDRDGIFEIWTIPHHEKRLVRIGRVERP